MNKPNLFWGCKNGSVSANQSMCYITLKMKNKSYDFLSFAKRVLNEKGETKTVHVYAKLLHSCPTLYNPMRNSPPGFSLHGIFEASILEWVAIPFSRGSSQVRD